MPVTKSKWTAPLFSVALGVGGLSYIAAIVFLQVRH
jgi:hypothetical protein